MGATLHEKRCLDVLHSTSVADFKNQVVAFVQHLGFSTFGTLVVTDHSSALREFKSLNNAPEAYVEAATYSKFTLIDPVLQHCKLSNAPIVWDQRDYAFTHTRPLWEEQEPFGYKSGLAVGMHFARGRHFVFGANWARDRCSNAPHFKSIAEDLLSFAEHAQAAAFELTLPARQAPDAPLSLANLELEAIRWTMDGMNSWEVADRMLISERHATLLTRRAMHKLDCSTKYEAVLRAIKLGLIEAV